MKTHYAAMHFGIFHGAFIVSKSAVTARQAFPTVILTPHVLGNTEGVTNDFTNIHSHAFLVAVRAFACTIKLWQSVVTKNTKSFLSTLCVECMYSVRRVKGCAVPAVPPKLKMKQKNSKSVTCEITEKDSDKREQMKMIKACLSTMSLN